ncbi:MAG TPA: OmpA family protein [Bacteroidia bacterium]|nr:OmpA family protein [Bacteroidia bacterium]
MPWGYGGTDIYKVELKNGKWSEPMNLGNAVNSDGNEMFPFVAADSVIYFASDGHIGIGGLDIFSSYFDGEKWSKPENLQFPVNSSKDDFGFIIDSSNTSGYFTSNRVKNTDKIYQFKKNPPIFTYTLNVTEGKNLKAVKSFELFNVSEKGKTSFVKGVNGIAINSLNPNTDYSFLVQSNGYYTKKMAVSTVGRRKSEAISDSVSLEKIELNKAKIWRTIEFKKKDDFLSLNAQHALDSLVEILELNPEIQIEIASHTDSKGSFIDNLNLSKKRSDEISLYLINKGINPPRLISIGYGEAKLLNNCRDGILCLEEDHRVNNRVEIKVIDFMK